MKSILIGNVKIEKTAALAPMASVADRAYREMCKSYGAAYVTGEMASAKGLFYSDRKTEELLFVSEEERPMAIQLFGDDPKYMALAAEKAMAYKPDIIDINMGCPVPKVAGNGCGSALMNTPEKAEAIVSAMCRAVDVPITVKIRKGWNEDNINAVDFAKRMEQAGAAAVAVHGRTRQQMYTGQADWEIIRQVKEAVSIPVMGNGDVTSPLEAEAMYRQTGCDLVMIGRGSYGRPWLFEQIKTYFSDGTLLSEPPLEERIAVMLRHIELICQYHGENNGMRQGRKHAAWYLKGVRGAAGFRRECGALMTLDDLKRLAEKALKTGRQAKETEE